MPQSHLEGLFKHRWLPPTHPDAAGLVWGLSSRIAGQLPRDAPAAGPVTTLRIQAPSHQDYLHGPDKMVKKKKNLKTNFIHLGAG